MKNSLDKIIKDLQTKLEDYRFNKGTLPAYKEQVKLLLDLQEIFVSANKDCEGLKNTDNVFKKQAF